MRHLTLLIKPASGLCNMRCKYCFYYDEMAHRDVKHHGIMTEETMEEMIQKAYDTNATLVSFMFQGGEPTLAGLSYYESFVDTVKKHNTNNIDTVYSIQTNGVLIDAAFARFLKKYNFLVGISIDGNEKLHNLNRLDAGLEGSYKRVKKGLQHLQQQGVEYNILTVITKETTKNVESTYRAVTNLGTNFIQFIPCLDSFNNQNENYTLLNDDYYTFLVKLFDVWERDFYKGKRISIRYFDDLLKIILGYQPASCTLLGHCVINMVVESNGNVYPCDFYALDDYLLGSLHDASFEELVSSDKATEFINSSISKNEDCLRCKYYQLCKGGCRRNKEPFTDINQVKTKYCDAIYRFLDAKIDHFIKIAEVVRKELINHKYSDK